MRNNNYKWIINLLLLILLTSCSLNAFGISLFEAGEPFIHTTWDREENKEEENQGEKIVKPINGEFGIYASACYKQVS